MTMADLPKTVDINEEGPREGFQIEKGPIATARKIELVDSLSQTGLKQIQVASFVSNKAVPQWADAADVVAGFTRKPGIKYTALWLNDKGFERAIAANAGAPRLDLHGSISLTASEKFLKRNQNRTLAQNYAAQMEAVKLYTSHQVKVERASLMAAFGCNFEGDIAPKHVVHMVGQAMDIARHNGVALKTFSLADTMAWATPLHIRRTVGAVREAYPYLAIALHLHDTRGLGLANAYAGLEMGVRIFDSAVAGLGGCPFAAHKGAAGNVCTEDLVFMCEEMGIATGVNLDALMESARLAEDIVGHPLPGSVKSGGSLAKLRAAAKAA
jgi:hydroxymethylglutaryl-CoA lyase